MMRYVGLKYVEIWDRGSGIGSGIGSDRGEDEFKDQPRLIKNKLQHYKNDNASPTVRRLHCFWGVANLVKVNKSLLYYLK